MNFDEKIRQMLNEQAKILRRNEKTGKFGPKDKRWQKLRRDVFNKYGKVCMNCGSCNDLHVDHIKPKSKFPKLAYKFNNLQVLCKRCNYNKSNRHCHDFRMEFEQKEYEMAILAELTYGTKM